MSGYDLDKIFGEIIEDELLLHVYPVVGLTPRFVLGVVECSMTGVKRGNQVKTQNECVI